MSDSIRVTGAILRRKQVEQVVGLSRSTIYQRIKDGTFPRPVSLGGRMVGWRAADIEQFLIDPAGYHVASSSSDGEHDDD
ncbi:AlpA family phage regulatory protein [Paraburkholderia sp. Ac-20336]|uniref:helix-turn-helix transcriptional regulator n=1 Tax=Paraburkholderia sp. Ac-20336 TaxID=2703886 RepID=UPI00197EBBA3|nr:AlpA family transcriptional regulator [Paraburkholderia sp. Ac-20336]MBN3804360.1 AlpA family phage regulatory protein [Paraburkholderia sp. Ac-20336]